MKFLLALITAIRSHRSMVEADPSRHMSLREWADLPPYHPCRGDG